jgi:hypothetical protein
MQLRILERLGGSRSRVSRPGSNDGSSATARMIARLLSLPQGAEDFLHRTFNDFLF